MNYNAQKAYSVYFFVSKAHRYTNQEYQTDKNHTYALQYQR